MKRTNQGRWPNTYSDLLDPPTVSLNDVVLYRDRYYRVSQINGESYMGALPVPHAGWLVCITPLDRNVRPVITDDRDLTVVNLPSTKPVSQGNQRGSVSPWLSIYVAVVAGMLGLLVFSIRADASPEFRAACISAHRNPYAPTGRLCRSKGWTVRHRIVVTPHRVVVYTTLPTCAEEDASSGPVPCSWNFDAPSSAGKRYYVTNPHTLKAHYIKRVHSS